MERKEESRKVNTREMDERRRRGMHRGGRLRMQDMGKDRGIE